MTLNSLPIKDKSPFHTGSSICQCHHTKERGNLFMPNMPPVSTFGRPFEHCFLIKRGSLSSLFFFFSSNVSLIPLSSARNSHDNISFNYSFIVTTIRVAIQPFSPPQANTYLQRGKKSDTWVCIETALIFTHHTLAGARGPMAFICKKPKGTRTARREAVGWRRMEGDGEGGVV